jgi:hypothetical protein
MSAAPDALAAQTFKTSPMVRETAASWLIVAALNFTTQAFLYRKLMPGQFGTMNTVLGIVAVLCAPLIGFHLVWLRQAKKDAKANGHANWIVTQEAALLAWGGMALALLFVLLPMLALPQRSLYFFTMLCTGVAMLAVVVRSRCTIEQRNRFWCGLAITAAAVRLLASIAFSRSEPWAQSALAAVILAGIVTAIPAIRDWIKEAARGPARAEAWTLLREMASARPFLATLSVVLAIGLFTNADRIVAQANFGAPDILNFKFVDWRSFDDFQAEGMLARAVLWGAAPLLLVLYVDRIALDRTSRKSLRFFWLYLIAIFGGDLMLGLFAPFLSWIFTGNAGGAARFTAGFVGAVPLLGLLQGLGIFALASRRHSECFVLGGCSVAYTIFLFFGGHDPQLMTACMFGGALISLTAVLFVGVVRYARNHP